MNAISMLSALPTPDLDPTAAARVARVAHRALDREARLASNPAAARIHRTFAILETPAMALAAVVYLLWAVGQLMSILT